MFINNFDPVAFHIFSLEIRWYSLAYIVGIILGWTYCKKKLIKDKHILDLFDDFITYLIIGVILGGRIGYALFYNLEYYLENPFEILMVWNGGMSFHGGLIGVIVASQLFSSKHKVNQFIFLDLVALSAPIGIFFGRIANFINSELPDPQIGYLILNLTLGQLISILFLVAGTFLFYLKNNEK